MDSENQAALIVINKTISWATLVGIPKGISSIRGALGEKTRQKLKYANTKPKHKNNTLRIKVDDRQRPYPDRVSILERTVLIFVWGTSCSSTGSFAWFRIRQIFLNPGSSVQEPGGICHHHLSTSWFEWLSVWPQPRDSLAQHGSHCLPSTSLAVLLWALIAAYLNTQQWR